MMIKLKTILTEGFAWERKEGKGLPTLAEVQAEYEASHAGGSYESMTDSQLIAAADDAGMEEMIIHGADGDLENRQELIDLLNAESEYADDEVDDDGYPVMDGGRPSGSSREVDEASGSKPDFLDLDGDGNEKESMKSAAADSTDYGNYINKARAKSHLATNAGMVYGIDGSGKGHPITNASEIEKYSKWTIKSESMNEGFVSRIKKNLIGGDYRR